jgi:hypothetical protein
MFQAITLVLLILILWIVLRRGEGYLGAGVGDQIYTSGATMRRLGQVFSQPGQGHTTTIYNVNRKEGEPEKVDVMIMPILTK